VSIICNGSCYLSRSIAIVVSLDNPYLCSQNSIGKWIQYLNHYVSIWKGSPTLPHFNSPSVSKS